MNALLLSASLFLPAADAEHPPVWVELETADNHSDQPQVKAFKVELLGFEDGRYIIRTRDGITVDFEEEKVRRIAVLKVGGEQPWKKKHPRDLDPAPSPTPYSLRIPALGDLTRRERRSLANVVMYLRPTPERVADLMRARAKGRLEGNLSDVETRIKTELESVSSVSRALELVGDLMAIRHMQRLPQDKTTSDLDAAARSIRDDAVRAEVLETLRFLADKLPSLEWIKQQMRDATIEYIRRLKDENERRERAREEEERLRRPVRPFRRPGAGPRWKEPRDR